MTLIIKSSHDLPVFTAEKVRAAANRSVEARGRFLIALSGGGTPMALYHELAQLPDHFPWAQTHVFWGDERMVPHDDPGSNYGQAKKTLLDHVSLPPENIHPVNTTLSAADSALDYADEILAFADPADSVTRLDLVLLGLGTDGHTASLFPGSALDTKDALVIAVTADYEGRPAHRVTLTPKIINNAREIFFLVSGESKARTLAAVLEGDPDPVLLPAQRIQPESGSLTWLVDGAASSKLSIK